MKQYDGSEKIDISKFFMGKITFEQLTIYVMMRIDYLIEHEDNN